MQTSRNIALILHFVLIVELVQDMRTYERLTDFLLPIGAYTAQWEGRHGDLVFTGAPTRNVKSAKTQDGSGNHRRKGDDLYGPAYNGVCI